MNLKPCAVSSLQVTLAVCFLLMFGNSMLLTSFYASSLVSIWVSFGCSGAASTGGKVLA